MDARRLWAIAALVLAAISLVLAVALVVARFPRGLSVLACLVIAALSGWYGIRHRGTARIVGMVAAALLVALSIVLILVEGTPLLNLVVAVTFVVALAVAPRAFKVHVHLPRADPPARAVLVYNPKSGGGKAEKFHLADEARRRGIEPIRAEPGRRSREADPRRRRARRRRTRRGGRGRYAGHRGDGGRRAQPALRVHPRRHAQPLCPRPRRGSERRGRGARRVRQRGGARRRSGRGQRTRIRQQRVVGAVRGGGADGPATARPRSARCSIPCPTWWGQRRSHSR